MTPSSYLGGEGAAARGEKSDEAHGNTCALALWGTARTVSLVLEFLGREPARLYLCHVELTLAPTTETVG